MQNERVVVVQKVAQIEPKSTEDFQIGLIVGAALGIILGMFLWWLIQTIAQRKPPYNPDYWWNDGRKPDESQ